MFRIGEFSKIAQVPGSQLRYYDEIGLLKPAKIDKWTGYRYYSASQLPDLNRILALKELGLSLNQIRQMLNDAVSAEEIRGMFALKKAQTEQTVRDELTRLRAIEARLTQIENGNSLNGFEVIVKSVPSQHFLALRKICLSFEVARASLFEMYQALPRVVGAKNLGYFTAILHSEMYDSTDIDVEMGFVVKKRSLSTVTLESGQVMEPRILSAVETMVTAVHIGPLDQSLHCRASLATWIEANGYEFDGNGREVFIVPPVPGKEDEAVLEVQYPVTRARDADVYLTV